MRAGPAVLLLAALALCPRAAGQEGPEPGILLRGGTLLTMTGDPVPDGGLLIRGTKIASVGRALPAPEGAAVVDCAGRFVVPGFIDACTNVGLVDIELVKAANDADEGVVPSTPDVDVRDGINIESPVFGITRSHGVTTVLVAPGSVNVVGGLGAVVHCLDGAPLAERTVLAPSGLHIAFGEGAKERFGKKDQMPSTRMGVAAVLRKEFGRARDYLDKKRRYEEKRTAPRKEGEETPEPPAVDNGLEVLGRALSGEIPVHASAERLDDIRTALRLAEEFHLRLVLVGAADAWKIARELAERKVPVIYGPAALQPETVQTAGARMDAPRLLREAGVLFCLATFDSQNARNLPYQAGIAASWGLPEADALASITRDAAKVLGLEGTLGALEAGREATLCVFRGSPLEPLSRLERMYIRGKEVPLRSRQTDLYEKWKDR